MSHVTCHIHTTVYCTVVIGREASLTHSHSLNTVLCVLSPSETCETVRPHHSLTPRPQDIVLSFKVTLARSYFAGRNVRGLEV